VLVDPGTTVLQVDRWLSLKKNSKVNYLANR
jgi:hypothetical protein